MTCACNQYTVAITKHSGQSVTSKTSTITSAKNGEWKIKHWKGNNPQCCKPWARVGSTSSMTGIGIYSDSACTIAHPDL